MRHTSNSMRQYMRDASTTFPKLSMRFPSPHTCTAGSHHRRTPPLAFHRLHITTPNCHFLAPLKRMTTTSLSQTALTQTPLMRHLALLRDAHHLPCRRAFMSQNLDHPCHIPMLFPCHLQPPVLAPKSPSPRPKPAALRRLCPRL